MPSPGSLLSRRLFNRAKRDGPDSAEESTGDYHDVASSSVKESYWNLPYIGFPAARCVATLTPDFVKTHRPDLAMETWTGISSLRFGFGDLRKSQSRVCNTCLLIYQAIHEHSHDTVIDDGDKILLFRDCHPLGQNKVLAPVTVQVLRKELRNKSILDLELYSAENKSQYHAIGPARNIATDALSQDSISLVMSWLEECTALAGRGWHKYCSPYTETCLPRRLISVGADLENPRLITTDDGSKGKYIALSYCWGRSVPLVTNTSTINSMQSGIPLETFPKTIRDAIHVSRAYKVPYLWVDALCILQDSSDDWASESQRMGRIYNNAYFVIAADAALDCNDGFLSARSRTSGRVSVPLQCTTKSGAKETIFARRRGQIPKIEPDAGTSAFSQSIAHTQAAEYTGRLFSRAWVFQERLLACRTLCFSTEEFAFECKSVTRCECMWTVNTLLRGGTLTGNQSDLEHDSLCSLTSAYTQLSLTKEDDRLPAFSGVAAFMETNLGYSYLAGLWKQCLPMQLLWAVGTGTVISKPVTTKRFAPYQAPTWSWASIQGPVIYDRYLPAFEVVESFKVLEAQCTLAGPNRYGPVQEGHIKVSGPCTYLDLGFALNNDAHSGFSLFFTKRQRGTRDDEAIGFSEAFKPDICGENLEVSSGQERLAVLIVAQWRYKTDLSVMGLVLVAGGGRKLDTWKRVGCFMYSADNKMEVNALDKLLEAPALKMTLI